MLRVLLLIILVSASAFAQSGRRNLPPPTPTPTPTPEEKPSPTSSLPPGSQVTAERDEDYRCTDDGTLARLLDHDQATGYEPKEVDVKAEITAKLCTEGGLAITKVPRRDKAGYASARRWRWGDAVIAES